MAKCVVGDDIYKDCPTTNKLERQVADLLGKEAALMTCSGSQANLISQMLMARRKGDAVILGHLSHIMCYERGGIAGLASILPRVLQNEKDGTIDLKTLELTIPPFSDQHVTPIVSIGLESSQNNCSGRVLRMDYIKKVRELANQHNLKMTLDGARSWNASVFLDIPMKEMVKDFDVVQVCMSKGMGCPIGSMIVGSQEDITQAINFRKILGGAMRQTGVIASCGIIALQDWQEKLVEDNGNAAFMAHELAEIKGVKIDPK